MTTPDPKAAAAPAAKDDTKATDKDVKAPKTGKPAKPVKETSERQRGDEYKEPRIYEAALPDGTKAQKRTKLKVGFTHLLVGKDPKNGGAWKAIRFSCSETRLQADVKRIEAQEKPRYTDLSIIDKVAVTDAAIEKPKKEKAPKKAPAKKPAKGPTDGKSAGYQTKRQAIAAARKILGLTGQEAMDAPTKKGDLWTLPKAS